MKREIRQRCGFGCVLCGRPLYTYEHMEGWARVSGTDEAAIPARGRSATRGPASLASPAPPSRAGGAPRLPSVRHAKCRKGSRLPVQVRGGLHMAMNPLRVVVAEDDRHMLSFLIEALGRLGHQAVGAGGGRQLVEMCRAVDPDLVLADVKMPDLDGIA